MSSPISDFSPRSGVLASGRGCVFILFLWVLFSIFVPSSFAAAETERDDIGSDRAYTMEQSVEQGLRANPRIKAAQAEVRKAESNVGEKRSAFLPSVTAQAGSQDIHSLYADGPTDQDYIDQRIDTLSLRISQTLFQGFANLNTYQKAQLRTDLMQARKSREEITLIRDIQTAFLELLKAQEDVASLEDSVRRLEVSVKQANSFHRQQVVPYVRVLQAEVDLADAHQKLSRAKNEVNRQRERLRTLLNLPQGMEPSYRGNLEGFTYTFDRDLRDCLNAAYESKPGLEVARRSLDVAREELDIRKGSFAPKVEVSGSLTHRNTDYDEPGEQSNPLTGQTTEYERDQKNNYASAQIQLTWPLFQGGSRYYQHQGARREIRRLEYRLRATRNQVRAEVRSNYSSLREARSRMSSARATLKAAEEGYERATKRYETKLGTLPELLDAEARLSRAEASLNRAMLDYQLALVRLYYAMGERHESLRQKAEGDSAGQEG